LSLEVIIWSICVILAIVWLIVFLIKYLLAPRNWKKIITELKDVMLSEWWNDVVFPVIVSDWIYSPNVRYYDNIDQIANSEIDQGLTRASYLIDSNQNKYTIKVLNKSSLIWNIYQKYYYDSVLFDEFVDLDIVKKLISRQIKWRYSGEKEHKEMIKNVLESKSFPELFEYRSHLSLDELD